ncbi:MAG: lipid-binding SYLF domain-containing protein [Sulfurovum sp.]|nr:lipid-binding SYLF domain-containing protein [Sulfurovum sp.]
MKKYHFFTLILVMLFALTSTSTAKSATELDKDANEAINTFIAQNKGGDAFLVKAKAFLVFPDIKEAGFFVGGKYGEGVLRVQRTTKAYYSIKSASVGMQMGVQQYAMIISFTSDASLNKFLLDDDWKTDIDGKIAMAEWNSKEELDDIDFDTDMVAFVFDSKGMMGSFTMEGTQFKRIKP